MNSNFKKLTGTAVVTAVTAALGSQAAAVSVNPDGVGQVLLFPYYTARTVGGIAQNSMLSIVNTTLDAKATYVKFFEAKNGRMVYGIQVYLSPGDVWTAVVTPASVGAAQLTTDDKSCTVPSQPPPPTSITGDGPPLPPTSQFVNYTYSGGNDDGAGTSLDRTFEGYVEVVEMGVVTGQTAAAITHSNGVPACGRLPNASADTVAPSGGLMGTLEIIDPLKGTSIVTQSVALDDFSDRSLYNAPGSILPDIGNVNPPVATLTSKGVVFSLDFTLSGNPADAVSAVLMHDAVFDQFLADNAGAMTSYVFTFPTKPYYYTGLQHTKLFQSNFGSNGACDSILITAYDRDERTATPNGPGALCWTTNVVNINNSDLFGSAVASNLSLPFTSGWTRIAFSLPGGTTHALAPTNVALSYNISRGDPNFYSETTLQGLPIIGFYATNTLNGLLQYPDGAVLSNFSAAVPNGTSTNAVSVREGLKRVR